MFEFATKTLEVITKLTTALERFSEGLEIANDLKLRPFLEDVSGEVAFRCQDCNDVLYPSADTIIRCPYGDTYCVECYDKDHILGKQTLEKNSKSEKVLRMTTNKDL